MIKIETFDKLNEKYCPIYIKSIKKGHGSFLTFELTKELQKGNIDAELWIYLTDWALFSDGKEILNSNIENSIEYTNSFRLINQNKILKIVEIGLSTIEIYFDNHIKLLLMSNNFYEEDDDMFMFYDFTNRQIISYSPEKCLYQEVLS